MWSVKYLSFIPAALFFPTVLTLLLLNWRQRRLRRRLRRSRIAAASQSTAPATLQAGTPEPASGGYAAELASVLADLRGEPAPRPALDGHNGS
jgi:hypothetical protein